MDLGYNEDIATMGLKDANDQNKESDFETFIHNSFIDAFYDDFDVSLANLFEADDLFFFKVDVMKSEFAYLCDVFPNGYSICNDHFMHMFDINSVQIKSFNLGTNNNPKNILLASDLTLDESEKMREVLIRRQKVFTWSYEDMSGIDRGITEHRILIYPHIAPVKQKKETEAGMGYLDQG